MVESERLERIAAQSPYAQGLNAVTVRYCAGVFRRHWRGTRCLELGPAEGLMTEELAKGFTELRLVDGSETFCRDLRERFPGVRVTCALFEEFEPGETFDTVVLGHVLEHVEDPRALLRRVREWLADDGVVCAAVPNAQSLHRQAAVLMRLLPHANAFSEADLRMGHRRVYNPETLAADFSAAGLEVRVTGGYWLKPLSNAQIENTWSAELVDAFLVLGEQLPEIAGEIYVIAERA